MKKTIRVPFSVSFGSVSNSLEYLALTFSCISGLLRKESSMLYSLISDCSSLQYYVRQHKLTYLL